MAELKILGARRVEALIDVLKDKKREELQLLGLTYRSVTREEIMERLTEDYPALPDALALVEEVFGYTPSVSSGSPYDKVKRQLNAEIDQKKADIEAKYKSMETQLWLCETLDQAKAIVYGTTDASKEGSA